MILKTYLLILILSIGHLFSFIPRELHKSPKLTEIVEDTDYYLKFIVSGKLQSPSCNPKDAHENKIVAVGTAATVGFCQNLLRKLLNTPSIDDVLKDLFDKEIKSFGTEIDKNELKKLLDIAKLEAKKKGIELDEDLVRTILANTLIKAQSRGIKINEIPLRLTQRSPASESSDILLLSSKKQSKAVPESIKNKNFSQVIKSLGAENQDEASALFDLATLANNRNIPNKYEGYAALAPIGEESLRVYLEVKKELDSKGYPKQTKEFIADVVLKRTGYQSDKLKITKDNLLHIANVHRATRNIPIRGSPETPVRFYIGEKPHKIAIIGRQMKGLVNETKEHLEKNSIKPKTFTPRKKARRKFDEKADDEGGWLSHEQLLETLSYKQNEIWAKSLLMEGYLIIDMGNPKGLSKSTFYEMEKQTIFNDK